MSAVLTPEQAEAAVLAAVDERDTIRASLADLDRSLGKRLLAGANVAGDTGRRWNGAAVDLTMLWEVFEAYSAAVDRAAAIQARTSRHGPGLAEITAVLTDSDDPQASKEAVDALAAAGCTVLRGT